MSVYALSYCISSHLRYLSSHTYPSLDFFLFSFLLQVKKPHPSIHSFIHSCIHFSPRLFHPMLAHPLLMYCMYAQCIYPKSHKLINKKTFIPAAQRFPGRKLEYALSGKGKRGKKVIPLTDAEGTTWEEDAVEHTFSGLLLFFFFFDS